MDEHESEKSIQKSILDYLRLKGFVAFKHNSTQFGVRDGKSFAFRNGERGISDIIACSPRGRFVAIEVKTKIGRPTEEQKSFITRIKSSGGVAFVAYSLDDAMAEIEALSKGNSFVDCLPSHLSAFKASQSSS